ncbi:uncharacterized protein LOC132757822 [Ruditapes philippinarum]|uniref:uncharacterized protein LOC132757822 n=1 Tax=Ruditapes philippinarum TaxID=129788 RepID=UPI00295C13A9|nr:uncharacterized protein LOC132757822 [Ruditapes philippinarum]
MKCLALLTICALLQGFMFQESGETENIRFYYEPHTHMMVITRQATCYMIVLTADEKAMVHTDTLLRKLELQLLVRINDPSTTLTPVPHFSLHSNLHKQCGRDMAQYYIIQ